MDFNPTYIRRLSYKNTGPIDSLEVNASFDEEGKPKPIVFVGENGSGKSTVLSNITDSMLEIAGSAYDDALKREGFGHQYFKEISSHQIRIGTSYQIARIDYTNEKTYIFKSGDLSFEEYRKCSGPIDESLNWNNEANNKAHSFSDEESENMFEKQVTCSFLSSRYEKPSWMGGLYFRNSTHLGPSVQPRYSRKIRNEIVVEECIEDTLQWLLDIIVDSRTDIAQSQDGRLSVTHNPNVKNTLLFGEARSNVERILSVILGLNVYFDVAYRNAGASRFCVKDAATGNVVCPSLDSLSTGQIILFELFSTIVRYGDNNDILNSVSLEDISGLVVVDEIDLHLHTSLQRDVLPNLIKLFPRIQFIISTHSPLLLLGLEREFGANGYALFEMPTGKKITAESFKEFEIAYETYASTKRYAEELEARILSESSTPLIITEGTTDWRILEKAQELLTSTRPELFERPFKYFKFGPKTDEQCEAVYEMGGSRLKSLCASFASVPRSAHGVIIAIVDRDDASILKEMDSDPFKAHGNGVFSFAIPLPSHRESTQNISIEQVLSDETLYSKVKCKDGVERRLYTSDEFDQQGRCIAENSPFFVNGKHTCSHTKILDGGNIKLFSQEPGDDKNYALSKIRFAKGIASGEIVLTDEDLKPFIVLFEKIQEIIKQSDDENGLHTSIESA